MEKRPANYVLDADIKSFFNHLDHEWIIRFIESRIKDPNIIRLVRRTLKSGVMEDFQHKATEEGFSQNTRFSSYIPVKIESQRCLRRPKSENQNFILK